MKLVIVSHGNFAQGACDSLEMICGKSEIAVIKMGEEVGQFERTIGNMKKEEMIFFVDIPGGHPFNIVYKYILNNDAKQMIVGGFNLPILIETNIQSNFKNMEQLFEVLKANDIPSIVIAKNWN